MGGDQGMDGGEGVTSGYGTSYPQSHRPSGIPSRPQSATQRQSPLLTHRPHLFLDKTPPTPVRASPVSPFRSVPASPSHFGQAPYGNSGQTPFGHPCHGGAYSPMGVAGATVGAVGLSGSPAMHRCSVESPSLPPHSPYMQTHVSPSPSPVVYIERECVSDRVGMDIDMERPPIPRPQREYVVQEPPSPMLAHPAQPAPVSAISYGKTRPTDGMPEAGAAPTPWFTSQCPAAKRRF
ncbi:hypothetical protein KIPB_007473 [Kipferlia bialata]|uniref:Uncharacterized protein n=1 Tax=Kipferlia bialata TaxID=797122 RepID=A0A9K3GKM2_9EUKA|nr:hypothetical protein KIPB_007473 [Kipferlia bialata]|eukprot:g7473.t1